MVSAAAADLPKMRARIEALVRAESPSTNKAAVDRCGALVESMLAEEGAAVTRLPQANRGNHLRAEFAGGPRRILLLGHFDTVWDVGQIERMPFREADGRLYGPGIYDMKASIPIALLAVRLVPAAVRPRIVILLTTDEEVGSETSRAAIEHEELASDAVLVLEPSLPGGAAKTARKGCGEFLVRARGVSAHAGIDPGNGASAIHELAHQIVALERLRDVARGISVNVGVISGGTRGNVIAEEASAIVDVRVPTMEDAARVEAAVRGLTPRNAEVTLEVSGAVARPPLERKPAGVRLYEEAKAAAAVLGVALQEGATGGGSDGNFTAAVGVPTLDGLGPQGDGAHALHEHVLIDDLPWRAAFLALLMERLAAR